MGVDVTLPWLPDTDQLQLFDTPVHPREPDGKTARPPGTE